MRPLSLLDDLRSARLNLIIFGGNLATSIELRGIIGEKLHTAFAQIDARLSCIRISVHDRNGNRPGLTKRCQLIITQEGKSDIVINSSAGKTRKAVAQAISRAAHVLTQNPAANPAVSPDAVGALNHSKLSSA